MKNNAGTTGFNDGVQHIDVVDITGRTLSQALDSDGDIRLLDMPSGGMETYNAPILPEPEEQPESPRVLDLLERVKTALVQWNADSPNGKFSLNALSDSDITFLNQILGEGEVSITREGLLHTMVQESVLAGVWRVQVRDTSDKILTDYLETGPIPQFVRDLRNSNDAGNAIVIEQESTGMGNVAPILVEIEQKSREPQPVSGDPYVINLTLLPLSDLELQLIGHHLGTGPVNILSRGYGNCRIGSTRLRDVWWIKYFNSEDKLILNTIEICEVPPVALAAPEDIADSADRLEEILRIYR
ncbi:hydrogenase expression/formation protein [Parasalinivibrio latis]|uniref:hydrogenase expression/formation protein n=1 Tax=Parasalinivibrio latis TaxID=2952610 RepID=UPI0030DDE7D5